MAAEVQECGLFKSDIVLTRMAANRESIRFRIVRWFSEYRLEKCFSQARCAKMLDCNQSTFARYESGETRVSDRIMLKMIEILDKNQD